MKVPTILAERGIQTGSTGPDSSAEDFGLGTSRATLGLAGAVNSFQQPLGELAELKARRKELDDAAWLSKSLSQENNHLMEWLNDEKNNTSPDFADNFKKYVEEREKVYTSAAPSARASKLFSVRFASDNEAKYGAALRTSATTRVTNLEASLKTQGEDAVNSWRTALTTPGINADDVALKGVADFNAATDVTFGKYAPERAKDLKNDMTVQMVMATTDTSPPLARKILSDNKRLDERTRATLTNHIEQAERSLKSGNALLLGQQVDDSLADASRGIFGEKLGMSTFKSIYPDAQSEQRYAEYSAKYDAFLSADQHVRELSILNEGAESREFMRIAKSARGEAGKLMVQAIDQRLDEVRKFRENDPAGWMQTYNPAVKSAMQRAPKLPDGSYDFSEAHALMVKYQGVPEPDEVVVDGKNVKNPKAVPQSEKDMYLYKPIGSIRLVPVPEAEAVAESINNGSLTQKLDEINTFLSRYKPEYYSTAFNDLVMLPGKKGIKQEMQLAFLNRDQMWVKKYLGAISGVDFSKFTDDKRKDFQDELIGNPMWKAFANPMMGDSNQGGEQVQGFQDGILNYAYSISSKGVPYERAVQQAVDDLLLSEMGTTQVNGQTMWMMRKRTESNYRRTDDEVRKIGTGLTALLATVPTPEIARKSHDGYPLFPGLEDLPSEKSKTEKLHAAIQTQGYWVTDPDGNGATLYYNDGAHDFQLTTKDFKPLSVRFEDIEARRSDAQKLLEGKYRSVAPYVSVEDMTPSGPVRRLPGVKYHGLYSTNWPAIIKPRE